MDLTAALDVIGSAQRSWIDRDAGRLVGSRCDLCAAVSWPGRPICERCGQAGTTEFRLTDTGTLITYTTVWVSRPGLVTPYVLGQVDLDDGVRIFAHGRGLTERHRVPLAVRLIVRSDPVSVPPFVFEPAERP
jgi:uncharacterized protein